MEVLNSESFKEKINSGDYVLVDFFASWCMPCKMLSPILEALAEEYKGKMQFAKVDIDQEEELAREYDIFSVPSMLLFKDGKKVDMSLGYSSAEELKEFLSMYVD